MIGTIEALRAATIADGGATVYAGTLAPVAPPGWVVGGVTPEQRVPLYPPGLTEPSRSFAQAIEQARSLDTPFDGVAVVGTWIEDGHIVIDACTIVYGATRAILLGIERDQRAIHSLDLGITVWLEDSGS